MLDEKTKDWIKDIVAYEGGDPERAVRWLCSIGFRGGRKVVRALVAEALR